MGQSVHFPASSLASYHPSQRWLFWIEGALTIAIAILMAFILPDFPDNSRFLSPLERKLAQVRMEEDAGEKDTGDDSTWTGFKMAVTDWKVWYMAFTLTALVVALSFNAYFPSESCSSLR